MISIEGGLRVRDALGPQGLRRQRIRIHTESLRPQWHTTLAIPLGRSNEHGSAQRA